MEAITDINERRWKATEDPNKHEPEAALAAVQRDIASGKLKPRHLIIIAEYENDDGEASGIAWFQAGRETPSGQVGILARAMHDMMGAD